MPEWALVKEEKIDNTKIEIALGFFGTNQAAAFEARQFVKNSYVTQRL